MSKPSRNIAQAILEYLLANPRAEDTLEGITSWWLLERTIKQQTQQVKAALEMLIEEDLVIAVRGRGGHTHYKVNRKRHKKIVSSTRT